MKKIQGISAHLFLILLLISSCQKEQQPNVPTGTPIPTLFELTITKARAWYQAQLDSTTNPIKENQINRRSLIPPP